MRLSHLCHEDGDTFVQDCWQSPYDVPEAAEMKFAPHHIEAARRAEPEADAEGHAMLGPRRSGPVVIGR
ncbi:hypothetical protein ABT096_11240 [Streptomyces sp. NPDC002561]|uniref:hypothetical protein n=1 Tax=Streptomyces sp. NPDC002561 TaxID=3154418 RepID=UPI0033238192